MAVTLGVEAPQQQRRWTVAVRGILAIPHFFYAAILGFVSVFAVIIAWFAALFTGRVPAGIAEFLTRVMQYTTRVYGYAQMLLTDRYPPFDLGEIDTYTPYPIELTIERTERLNRAAVLFRAILMIPAGIVVQLVSGGLLVVLIVVWLMTLITGRIPRPAFEANASVLRYFARFYAFAAMLTSEYPRGLFGDRPTVAAVSAGPVVTGGTIDVTAADLWPDAVDGAPFDAPPDATSPLDAIALPSDLPATPRVTRLVLSRAAKNLLVLMLVLGVVAQGANAAFTIGRLGSSTADDLADHHATLETAVQTYITESQQCGQTGDLLCARAANGRLINAFEEFRRDLASMDFPAQYVHDARTLDGDAFEMISILAQLSEATNAPQYQALAGRLTQAGVAFDRHYADLYNELAFG